MHVLWNKSQKHDTLSSISANSMIVLTACVSTYNNYGLTWHLPIYVCSGEKTGRRHLCSTMYLLPTLLPDYLVFYGRCLIASVQIMKHTVDLCPLTKLEGPWPTVSAWRWRRRHYMITHMAGECGDYSIHKMKRINSTTQFLVFACIFALADVLLIVSTSCNWFAWKDISSK